MIQFRPISELHLRHDSEHAWIFGKGPGLDSFPQVTAGSLRICINESLCSVGTPTYFFAHDELPIKRVAQVWPDECRAILEQSRAGFAHECGIPADSIYVYEKRQTDIGNPVWGAAEIRERDQLVSEIGNNVARSRFLSQLPANFCCQEAELQ